LDISPDGLFFCPDNTGFSANLNDNVTIDFEIPGKPAIPAVIKWKGHSQIHGVSGVGCSGRL
jgi:hypothetical protein